MHWLDNSTGHPRLGLMVPRFQSTAVARNRLRRQLKEIWRLHCQPEAGAIDVIIRTRRTAYGAKFETLRGELEAWWSSIRNRGAGREAV